MRKALKSAWRGKAQREDVTMMLQRHRVVWGSLSSLTPQNLVSKGQKAIESLVGSTSVNDGGTEGGGDAISAKFH